MTKELKRRPGEPDGLFDRTLPTGRRETRSALARLKVLGEKIILPYPYAASVESEIQTVLERGRRRQFFSGALIVGPRSNGRTTLAEQIVSKLHRNAWLLQMPTRLGHNEFWLTLLDKARRYRSFVNMHSAEREFRAIEALRIAKSTGLKLIIIDDCESLLEATPKRRRLMLHCVAAAWKQNDVPVVLIVTPQLASLILKDYERVGLHEIFLLPQWRVDHDFLDMLEAWEKVLPLKRPSGLTQRELAMHLYALSDGRLGMLAAILTKTAEAAIKTGHERITIELLDQLGYDIPASFSGFVF